MLDCLRPTLDEKGWALIPSADAPPVEEFSQTLRQFGRPVPVRGEYVQRVVPLDVSKARPSSLSVKFGLGEFPLHTDAAHHTTPARWLVLQCEDPGEIAVGTKVLHFQSRHFTEEQMATIGDSLFLVRNGRYSFYTSILRDRRFIRYDPGCFVALDAKAKHTCEIFREISQTDATKAVRLNKGDMLVIDNWTSLHGRDPLGGESSTRSLLRGLAHDG